MRIAEVIKVVVDKFASKKFGILSLANTLIMILCWGRSEIVVVVGITAICCLSAVGVFAIARWSDEFTQKYKNEHHTKP
jgi:hypothetical protein